jgi:hypothetical protein
MLRLTVCSALTLLMFNALGCEMSSSRPPEPTFHAANADLVLMADDILVVVHVSPGTAGDNHFDFYLEDRDGDEREFASLTANFTFLNVESATRAYEATPVHADHFVIDGRQIAHDGRWRLDVVVKRGGLPEAKGSSLLLID